MATTAINEGEHVAVEFQNRDGQLVNASGGQQLVDLPHFRRKSPRLQQIQQSFVKPGGREVVGMWMSPGFRSALARCIPYVVGLIWRDGLVDLQQIGKIPIFAMLGTAQRNSDGVWERLFDRILRKPALFNTAALVLALAFARRLKQCHERYRSCMRSFLDRCSSENCVQFEFAVYLIGLLMAHKYTEDTALNNKAWAEITGIDLHKINQMEREALCMTGHGLYVGADELDEWLQCIQSILSVPTRRLSR